MRVNFAKMHGLGNDFVVIDLITQNIKLEKEHIKRIANRHLGVGCDQVIIIEPPTHKHSDFYYRIFNADGEEVEQCGNGARCAARFFYDSGYINTQNTANNTLIADCLAGKMEFKIEEDENVSVNMGKPYFSPHEIPLDLSYLPLSHPAGIPTKHTDVNTEPAESTQPTESTEPPEVNTLPTPSSFTYSIELDGKPLTFWAVSIGNPHAVLHVPNIDTADVHQQGAFLTNHPLFPNGTNVEFMQVLHPSHIRLRVFERGVGETLSCGTGACAATVAGIQHGLLKSPVTVSFPEGDLQIAWSQKETPIIMKGPATTVFVGRFRV